MAEKKMFYVHIRKIQKNQYHIIAVSNDRTIWYEIPEEERDLNNHPQIKENNIITNSIKTIKKIGGFRKLGITFNSKLKEEYTDSEGNFSQYDEYEEEKEDISKNEDRKTEDLLKKLMNLGIKPERKLDISEIERDFSIKKFNGRKNATRWLENFENQCEQFKMNDTEDKVTILKLFIEENIINWYNRTLTKISKTDWKEWKNSFLLTYGDENWDSIREAYNFKYIGGSIIDFIYRKEYLLLEADKEMPEKYRMFQIIFSLPIEIQNKLNSSKISTIDQLIKEIKPINNEYIRRKDLEDNKRKIYNGTMKKVEKNYFKRTIPEENRQKTYKETMKKVQINPFQEKKPCRICEGLGFNGRYHPIQRCRNKQKDFNHINAIEENNSTDDEEESHNESLN